MVLSFYSITWESLLNCYLWRIAAFNFLTMRQIGAIDFFISPERRGHALHCWQNCVACNATARCACGSFRYTAHPKLKLIAISLSGCVIMHFGDTNKSQYMWGMGEQNFAEIYVPIEKFLPKIFRAMKELVAVSSTLA